jgi:hypothetical protein
LKAGNRALAVDLLAQCIKAEQEYVKKENERLGYDTLIQGSLETVDDVFDELGMNSQDRAEIPDADHIHIIPSYLFYAQDNRYEKDTLGFVQTMNGHIFINHEALVHKPGNGSTDKERQQEIQQVLLHIINHEIIHGTSISNYHKIWKEENGKVKPGSEQYMYPRRLGSQLVRRTDKE